MGGLHGVWDWQELTPAKLRVCLESGQVLGLHRDGRLVATAIITEVDSDEKHLAIGYVEGEEPYASHLPAVLRDYTGSLGLQSLSVCLPSGSALQEAFLNNGYEPDTESKAEIWIYELHLKGISP
jgi:hypothetical protein